MLKVATDDDHFWQDIFDGLEITQAHDNVSDAIIRTASIVSRSRAEIDEMRELLTLDRLSCSSSRRCIEQSRDALVLLNKMLCNFWHSK